jgi:hypothetical protein
MDTGSPKTNVSTHSQSGQVMQHYHDAVGGD